MVKVRTSNVEIGVSVALFVASACSVLVSINIGWIDAIVINGIVFVGITLFDFVPTINELCAQYDRKYYMQSLIGDGIDLQLSCSVFYDTRVLYVIGEFGPKQRIVC